MGRKEPGMSVQPAVRAPPFVIRSMSIDCQVEHHLLMCKEGHLTPYIWVRVDVYPAAQPPC